MKLISIVTPCFNEEENVDLLTERIRAVFAELPQYAYEHIFIDNASSDKTVEKVKAQAAKDHRVKLIVNARNFGHIRSPVHGLLQARGDAVVCMASDLQDPPELIKEFLIKWEEGFKAVAAVKTSSKESLAMWLVRLTYYKFIGRISEVKLIENFTGFGLYDRVVLEVVQDQGDQSAKPRQAWSGQGRSRGRLRSASRKPEVTGDEPPRRGPSGFPLCQGCCRLGVGAKTTIGGYEQARS